MQVRVTAGLPACGRHTYTSGEDSVAGLPCRMCTPVEGRLRAQHRSYPPHKNARELDQLSSMQTQACWRLAVATALGRGGEQLPANQCPFQSQHHASKLVAGFSLAFDTAVQLQLGKVGCRQGAVMHRGNALQQRGQGECFGPSQAGSATQCEVQRRGEAQGRRDGMKLGGRDPQRRALRCAVPRRGRGGRWVQNPVRRDTYWAAGTGREGAQGVQGAGGGGGGTWVHPWEATSWLSARGGMLARSKVLCSGA